MQSFTSKLQAILFEPDERCGFSPPRLAVRQKQLKPPTASAQGLRSDSAARIEYWVTTAILSPKTRFCNGIYEGWNFNSGNYLFTTDTK